MDFSVYANDLSEFSDGPDYSFVPEIEGLDNTVTGYHSQHELCGGCLRGRQCSRTVFCLSNIALTFFEEGPNVLSWSVDHEKSLVILGHGDRTIRVFKDGDLIGVGTDFALGKTVVCTEENVLHFSRTISITGRFNVGWSYYIDEYGFVSGAYCTRLGLFASMLVYSMNDLGFLNRSQDSFIYYRDYFSYSPSSFPTSLKKPDVVVVDYFNPNEASLVREDVKSMVLSDHAFEPLSRLASIGNKVKKVLYKLNVPPNSIVGQFGSGYHDIKIMFSLKLNRIYCVDNNPEVFPKMIETFNNCLKGASSRGGYFLYPIKSDITLPMLDVSPQNRKSIIPFQTLDIAFSLFSFQHFCGSEFHAKTAMLNIVRALKPGGKIVMIYPDIHGLLQYGMGNDQFKISYPKNYKFDKGKDQFGISYSAKIEPNMVDLREYCVPSDRIVSMFKELKCDLVLEKTMLDFYTKGKPVRVNTESQQDAVDAASVFLLQIYVKRGLKSVAGSMDVKREVRPINPDVRKSVIFRSQDMSREGFIRPWPMILPDTDYFRQIGAKK